MRVAQARSKRFDPVELVPEERLHVATYSRLLGTTDPEFFRSSSAADAGYANGRPIPPAMLGFFLAVTGEQLEEDLGFSWGKTLNSEIDVWSPHPVGERDQLRATAWVEDAWRSPGRDGGARDRLILVTDFHRNGTLVCRWRVTFVEPSEQTDMIAQQPQDATAEFEAALSPAAPSESTPDAALGAGEELAAISIGPLTRLDLARMSSALDNPDPLHVDDEVARAAGFERVVGQGSAVVGLVYELVRRRSPMSRIVRTQVRQRGPFSIGDTLVARGRVGINSRDSLPLTGVRVEVMNQDGEVVAVGDVTVMD